MQSASSTVPRLWTIAFALFLTIWLALFFHASAGVRGSDQYWYVAEVRAVMAGDPRTNSLWAHFLLSDPDYLDTRPFVHQGAMPYLLGALRGLLSPYGAWIAFNLLATLLSAGLIFATLRRLAIDGRIALMASACFLALPVTFWYATQPLIEPAIGLLSSLMLAIALGGLARPAKFITLTGLAVIGQQILTIFVPALLAILVAFLWTARTRPRFPAHAALYLIVAGIGLFLATSKASTLGFGVTQLMMNGVPGRNNMDIWLREETLAFALVPFLHKLLANLAAFLTPAESQLFSLPPFVLILAVLAALVQNWRQALDRTMATREMLLAYIFAIGLLTYGAVIALHQNQARYLLYILPILFVAAAYFYRNRLIRIIERRPWIIGAAGAALLSACLILSIDLHRQSIASARDVAAVQKGMAVNRQLRDDRTVVECYRGAPSLLIDYALPRKIVVHIAPEFADAQLMRIADKSGARIFLCPPAVMADIRATSRSLALPTIATIDIGGSRLEAVQIR